MNRRAWGVVAGVLLVILAGAQRCRGVNEAPTLSAVDTLEPGRETRLSPRHAVTPASLRFDVGAPVDEVEAIGTPHRREVAQPAVPPPDPYEDCRALLQDHELRFVDLTVVTSENGARVFDPVGSGPIQERVARCVTSRDVRDSSPTLDDGPLRVWATTTDSTTDDGGPLSALNTGVLPHKGASDEDEVVRILECAGFECSYCTKANETVEELLSENPDVSFFWVHFPVDTHPASMLKAMGGVAARNQGKFWEYHDRVLEAPTLDTAAELIELAGELGLEPEMFEQTLLDPATEALVREQQAACRDAEVFGSPSFFIGDTLLVGARPFGEFQAAVDTARSAAQG